MSTESRTENPEIYPVTCQIYQTTKQEEHLKSMRKDRLSCRDPGKTVYPNGKKRIGTTPQTIHRDKFQMDWKCTERREGKREKEGRI